jgi:hypothetical protein|tara:strand:- start:69 stop:341 length:273 start_codon:yes stop_codon:yes gene_type:complete
MFGVKMAKSLLKKAKKNLGLKIKAEKAGKIAKKVVKEVSSSSAKSHVESLAHSRRDAAVVWGMIKDGSHSDAEIKEICKSKGFDTLLGEL